MLARIAADGVVLAHLAFILFVLAGGLLVWRWPRLAWLHIPALIWGVAVQWMALICPLTPLENVLRRTAGEADYHGGFVERYLLPLIYPAGLTADTQLLLGVVVIVLNGLIYGALGWRRARAAR
jgi:hypothetical protein